jgi:hypothetical protein
MTASYNGYHAIVQWLCSLPVVDIDAKTGSVFGDTALSLSKLAKHDKIVELL